MGEPIFLATPIFRVPEKLFFKSFTNIGIIGMWGIEIGVFDAAESIPGVYLVVKQSFVAINCIGPIFGCRVC